MMIAVRGLKSTSTGGRSLRDWENSCAILRCGVATPWTLALWVASRGVRAFLDSKEDALESRRGAYRIIWGLHGNRVQPARNSARQRLVPRCETPTPAEKRQSPARSRSDRPPVDV